MGQNKKFFWIICFVTVIGAIYWSVMSVLQSRNAIFIVFLIVNIIALIINIICFAVDKKNEKSD